MAQALSDIPANQEPDSDRYKLLKTIGKGSFAKVVSACHLLTGTDVAIKIIDQRVVFRVHRSLLREVHCMADLDHPNIVRLFHACSTTESLFLVMELVPGGDMLAYLHAHGPMPEDMAHGVFRQLVSAVQYCHSKGIAHRDIKPQNVLLDVQMNPKLADFGSGMTFKGHQLSTLCGSPLYAAPELFLGKEYDGRAVDAWSLGVLLFRVLTNTLPFRGMNLRELKQQVLSGEYVVPSYLSPGAENLLKRLLTSNPQERENLRDIMPDPWLNTGWQEELTPYVEPPTDVIDPWVKKEMLMLGFRWEHIRKILFNKTFNNLTATYRILKTKKPVSQHCSVLVDAFQPPEAKSCSPSPAQEPDVSRASTIFSPGDFSTTSSKGNGGLAGRWLNFLRKLCRE